MEKHEYIHKNFREIFINNFIGGVAWGLGGTVGIAIVLAIFSFILGRINFIPIVGKFVSEVATFVVSNNPQLLLK